jgi:hypothetical protein
MEWTEQHLIHPEDETDLEQLISDEADVDTAILRQIIRQMG